MKARVNSYLNMRLHTPEILPYNNPDDAFFSPNDVVEIVNTVIGETYKGNDVWHKLDTGVFISNYGIDIDKDKFFRDNAAASPGNDLSKKIMLNVAAGKNGRGITIGVLDSGIDVRHPSLKMAVTEEVNCLTVPHSPRVTNKHGSMVAGILSGNDHKISGLAIDASIKSYRVIGDDEFTDEFGLKAALEKIIATDNDIDILNLSLDISNGAVSFFQEMIDTLVSKGTLIIVAGNESSMTNLNNIASLQHVIPIGIFSASEFDTIKANGFPKDIPIAFLNNAIVTTGIVGIGDDHAAFSNSSAYTAVTTGILTKFLSNKFIPKSNRLKEAKDYLQACSFNIKQDDQPVPFKPYKYD